MHTPMTITLLAAALLLLPHSINAGTETPDTRTPDTQIPDSRTAGTQTFGTPEIVNVYAQAIPPATSTLTTSELAPGVDTGDALRKLLGVSGSRMGGHGIDPTIRGLSQTQLNVLLDGAYLQGGCPNRMDPPTSYAAAGAFESVTVLRGTQTLEYGGGGPGGTVLFERVTERFDDNAGNIRASLSTGYQSNGDIHDANADLAIGNSTGFIRAIAAQTDAGNYDDGAGHAVRAGYQEQSGSLILGYTPSDDTRLELSLDRSQTDDTLYPGAGMDSPESSSTTLRLKAISDVAGPVLQRIKFELYQSEVDHVMDNYSLRPNTGMKMRAPSSSDTTGGRLVAELLSPLGLWKVGADIQNNAREAFRFNDTGPQSVLNSVLWPEVDIEQTGVFAELAHTIDPRNRLIAGLRYDQVDSSAASTDQDPPSMLLSPDALYATYYADVDGAEKRTDHNIGGLLRLEHTLGNNSTLYAGLARSVRTPDATERYIASNSMMPSGRWVGNPTLAPETHHQVELGLLTSGKLPAIFSSETNASGDTWSADASVYYNQVSDYVLRDRFVAAGNNASIYRSVDAVLFGGEASLRWQWDNGWQSAIGAAYVRAENTTDDRAIAQIPPLEGFASLEYSTPSVIFGADIRMAAQQDRVDLAASTGIEGQGLDVQKTPSWLVANLYANYTFSDQLSLRAGVDNLFDENYAQHLNRGNAFDPTQIQVNEPGRNLWLQLQFTL